jgi:hypothetical protein
MASDSVRPEGHDTQREVELVDILLFFIVRSVGNSPFWLTELRCLPFEFEFLFWEREIYDKLFISYHTPFVLII